jgi:hypothetical protein
MRRDHQRLEAQPAAAGRRVTVAAVAQLERERTLARQRQADRALAGGRRVAVEVRVGVLLTLPLQCASESQRCLLNAAARGIDAYAGIVARLIPRD